MPSEPTIDNDCPDCVVSDILAPDTGEQMCVTCPFCKQTVTAIITPEQIECPECKAVVKK